MLIRVRDVALPLGAPPETVPTRACKRIGTDPAALRDARIVRRSLDARHPSSIRLVYTVDLDLDLADAGRLRLRGAERLPDEPTGSPEPDHGAAPLPGPIVVVGAGPAGLFTALRLAEHGYAPLVLERGQPVDRRAADLETFLATRDVDPDSNWLFGEGGAGTFSDGKLTTRIGDPLVRRVLEVLVACGAPDDILVEAHPHVGTDLLRSIVPRLRTRIESAGGRVRFGCRVDGLTLDGGRVTAVRAAGGRIEAGLICLAIGHSARDTCQMLAEAGVPMAAKPFQMGLRIEHRQADLDRAAYGPSVGHPALPPAEYRLVARGRHVPRPVVTFCMCPGGTVVPVVSEPERLCTNGMSNRARDGVFANSGLVVTVTPDEFGMGPLDGIAYQRRWESLAFGLAGGDYTAPAQRVGDFLAGRPSAGPIETSYPLGVTPVSMREILPPIVALPIERALPVLARPMPLFNDGDAVLLGPEARCSSPVRILRNPETLASDRFPGIYPIGEGAGYAGGIMSAAVDGLRTAETIIAAYAPPSV